MMIDVLVFTDNHQAMLERIITIAMISRDWERMFKFLNTK